MSRKIFEGYGFPPKTKLLMISRNAFSGKRQSEIFDANNFDFADEIMMRWPQKQRTVYVGIKSEFPDWRPLSEVQRAHVENFIKYDFDSDGYCVALSYIGEMVGHSADWQFWSLKVRPRGA